MQPEGARCIITGLIPEASVHACLLATENITTVNVCNVNPY